MTSFSDTLTVGLVLVLIFGSIALYLYTRIQQAEQKIGLLESILLELKMSTEIKSYSELPAMPSYIGAISGSQVEREHTEHLEHYVPFDEEDKHSHSSQSSHHSNEEAVAPSTSSIPVADVEEYKSAIADAVDEEVVIIKNDSSDAKVSPNYEAMTLKELQTLAKSRGITGAGTMKKGPVIEALKTSDKIQGSPIEPGSLGTSTGSFLETSGSFLVQESQ